MLTIEDTTPHEYAARWGNTHSEAGRLFYDYSSSKPKSAGWYAAFLVAIDNLISTVRGDIQTFPPQSSFTLDDVTNLVALRAFVVAESASLEKNTP